MACNICGHNGFMMYYDPLTDRNICWFCVQIVPTPLKEAATVGAGSGADEYTKELARQKQTEDLVSLFPPPIAPHPPVRSKQSWSLREKLLIGVGFGIAISMIVNGVVSLVRIIGR